MKPKKLTSLMVMLLLALNATGQEQFFDDVYYSSNQSKEEASVEKNIKEEEKNDDLDAEPTETVLPSSYTRSDIEEERDVDEYNRRYSGYDDEAYAEEEEVAQEPEKTQVKVESDRRSDLEYSERIIRYHSPSKISIVGADQVDLYLEDGYYAYDYDTDYSNGTTNVSVNLNFGSPWYSWGWYDPWFYNPWGYYSSWWYRPYYWGWGGWYAGYYSPWYDPWWGPSWGWGYYGYYGGFYPHYHHYAYAPSYYHRYDNGRSSYGRNGRSSGYASSNSLRSSGRYSSGRDAGHITSASSGRGSGRYSSGNST